MRSSLGFQERSRPWVDRLYWLTISRFAPGYTVARLRLKMS